MGINDNSNNNVQPYNIIVEEWVPKNRKQYYGEMG